MTEYILTLQERLTLWAGQCYFETRQTRAIALACAERAKPLDWQGKAGRLTLDPPRLMASARELVDVPDLDPPMTAAILHWLLLSGFLVRTPAAGDMAGLAGLPVFVDTTCLPVRVNDLDVAVKGTGAPATALEGGEGHSDTRTYTPGDAGAIRGQEAA